MPIPKVIFATDSQIREITNCKWTKSSASAKAMADNAKTNANG